jgi:hypothetical protein
MTSKKQTSRLTWRIRLQAALYREVLYLIEQGVLSVETRMLQ